METTIPLYGFGGGGGGTGATLTVNAPEGSAVTITKGDKSKAKTATNGTAVFKGLATGLWTVTIARNGKIATDTVQVDADYEKTMVFYKRYGYRRAKNDSNPETRITYLFDAVGMTPMHVDLSAGNPVWGSGNTWESFVNQVARPVMLKTGGTVDYELDRNDQTKKASGGTSDISNAAYAGNAMVEFRKYMWVKRYEDADYQYVIFADEQVDDTYHAYAHTNAAGQVADAFYWGMFKGCNVSNKLRSIADKSAMVGQTRNTEVAYAQANGTGYDTAYNSGWQYIADLLTLISKSDNAQAAFGSGRSSSGNTSALTPGTTKACGPFWGSSNGISDVKVFWIEGFWGNLWESLRGLISKNGTITAKMVPPYNFDGTGYMNTGVMPGGTNGGYINSAKMDAVAGFVPITANGSGTTYYCDGLWFDNANVNYAFISGKWNDTFGCGPRDMGLNAGVSTASIYVGSRLSYVR